MSRILDEYSADLRMNDLAKMCSINIEIFELGPELSKQV